MGAKFATSRGAPQIIQTLDTHDIYDTCNPVVGPHDDNMVHGMASLCKAHVVVQFYDVDVVLAGDEALAVPQLLIFNLQ